MPGERNAMPKVIIGALVLVGLAAAGVGGYLLRGYLEPERGRKRRSASDGDEIARRSGDGDKAWAEPSLLSKLLGGVVDLVARTGGAPFRQGGLNLIEALAPYQGLKQLLVLEHVVALDEHEKVG